MELYGDALIEAGIALIAAAAVIAAIFGSVHIVLSKKLNRQLEKEYGPKIK